LEANGIRASAIPGGRGQFDVMRDSAVIFSKRDAGRFPEHDEILRSLAEGPQR
jgi:predicted Rdx family selenoprotein